MAWWAWWPSLACGPAPWRMRRGAADVAFAAGAAGRLSKSASCVERGLAPAGDGVLPDGRMFTAWCAVALAVTGTRMPELPAGGAVIGAVAGRGLAGELVGRLPGAFDVAVSAGLAPADASRAVEEARGVSAVVETATPSPAPWPDPGPAATLTDTGSEPD